MTSDSRPLPTAKAGLRRRLRAERRALPAASRLAAADAVATHALRHADFSRPGFVAGYWAMSGEVPLHVLQLRLPPGQRWCLPVVAGDGQLRFAPWRTGDPLRSNRFGIPEPDVATASLLPPEAMTMVFLPLLAYCRDGRRLGQGGGYYDRSFAFRREQAPPPHLVGVGYDFQERPSLPADPWDVRLDAVVNDRGWLDCERP